MEVPDVVGAWTAQREVLAAGLERALQGQAMKAKKLEYRWRFSTPGRCAICPRVEDVLMCSNCGVRFYCCELHQRMDWELHRPYCRAFVDRAPLAKHERIHNALSFEERSRLVDSFIEDWWAGVRGQQFPPAGARGVFGISAEDASFCHYVGVHYPAGPLMLNCWIYIVQCLSGDFSSFFEQLREALLKGRLPQFFRRCSTCLKDKCRYNREIFLRDYKGIPWDVSKLAMLAGECW